MLPTHQSEPTLVRVLQSRASVWRDKQAFRFVGGNGAEEQSLTYQELHERAMAIGGELQTLAGPGERAMLLFPPGLDFVTAFFGCLYAGIVAVPAAPPARNRSTSSIEAIFDAAHPSLVLSTSAHRLLAEQTYAKLRKLFERPWVATDRIDSARQYIWHDPHVDGRQTAFLQYTSGSTSSPKGVVLTHDNLIENAALIQKAFGNQSHQCGVSWLPLYHDMGLIGGVVQPVYCGGSCTLLAPAAFLQRPALWLETISKTGATVSGGPDFAFDLCARKVSPDDCKDLDLSRWEVAFTGAERIRAETIERFAAAFSAFGFRRESFFPCFGLAESTLMVTGGPRQTQPTLLRVRADALGRNVAQETTQTGHNSRTLVGCGQRLTGYKVLVVDPRSRLVCKDGEVGEIWVHGPSVARGYYRRPEATATTFGARLADTGEGPFLRTGDLGFFRNEQLFVTGRLKDVIIIRGRNYYPEDIERSVERTDTSFRAGHCAAFSAEVGNRDGLVVVQEIEPRRRDLDADAALRAIRRTIATQHELEVHAIVLAKAAAIPVTSSGKTRRSACRERYLNGQLEVVAQWHANHEIGGDSPTEAPVAPRPESLTTSVVENWLIQRIASRLHLPPSQVHVATPFLEFGMGSVDAVEIAAELEQWLGRRMSPTVIYNHPTIAALAQWLVKPPAASRQPVRPPHMRSSAADLSRECLLHDVRQMTDDEMRAFIVQEMAKQ